MLLAATLPWSALFGGRYVLTAGTSCYRTGSAHILLVLSSVKALATLRWLQGPPRPGFGLLGAGAQLFSPAFTGCAHRVGRSWLAIAEFSLCKASNTRRWLCRTLLPGSLHCRPSGAQFAQGVNHTMLAAQPVPLGYVLQTPGHCSGIGHLTTAGKCRRHGVLDLLAGRSSFIPSRYVTPRCCTSGESVRLFWDR